MPPVFSRVKISFPIAGDLECVAEVVRHVSAQQAAAWGMSPGFGVQFSTLTAEQREGLERVVQGLPTHKPAPLPKSDLDDAAAEQVLIRYRKRINGDHYVVLALMQDAEVSEVRARGREAKRELDAMLARPISSQQRAQFETAAAKVKDAVDVLGNAHTRLEFDANRANFKGVARCIAAGLTVTEVEAARAAYLQAHPGVESKAHVKFVTGNAYEQGRNLVQALTQYEEALALDPLNLRYQQHYWGVKRRQHP
jgi:serine/threonine-protein kinase